MFLREAKNEYGTPVSVFCCDTCGNEFTVCPAMPKNGSMNDQWANCLARECGSYDPSRDADKFFDDGNVLSLAGRQTKIVRVAIPRPSQREG